MKDKYSLPVLLLVFVVLAAGIVAAGCLLYRSQQDICRTKAKHSLAAVADLKVRNLVDWRTERLSDAQMVMCDEFFGQQVREFLGDAAHATAPPRLLARLQSIREHNQGLRALLLDPQMNVRLASPEDKVYFGPIARVFTVKALRSNRAVMSDLHRSRFTGEIHLDLAIPLRDHLASPGVGVPPLGVIDIEVDPKKFIYPRIQDWPVPSDTAETLLIRREGNEAVFLNELKFQKNTALALRISLDNKNCPAVKAALGHEGIVEGVDYRGVPVLAAVRAVPDSPWFLVAKIDTAEVYAPMREWLWLTVLFVCTLLFGLAAAVGFLWRQRHFALYREKYEAEHRYRNLFESSRDAMMTIEPPSWKFTAGNPAMLEMFRLKNASELTTIEPWQLSPERQPDGRRSAEMVREMIETALREGAHFFAWTHKRIDGQEFPATVLLNRVEQAGKVIVQATVRDVTRQKQAEERANLEEARIKTLLELSQMTDRSAAEIAKHAMESAIKLTGSTIGYLAFANEDETVLTMHYWSQSAMQECTMVEKPIVYHVKDTGLWGEPIRRRKPIITNDYAASNPLKKGAPPGHVRLTRHMNIPVFDGGRIVAVAGVGNKAKDYEDHDIRQLTLFMDGMWRILCRKRAEEQLQSNVAELALVNKALEEAKHRADCANRAKSEFLANMSHEIRTPMTAILGFADLLCEKIMCCTLCADHAQCQRRQIGREAVDTIQRNGEHLLGVINGILDLSKIEAGKLQIEPTRCSPVQLVADVVSLMRVQAAAKHLELKTELACPLPKTVLTDPLRLRQVLVNLVGNAIKFTNQGEVRLAVRLNADCGRSNLCFDVTDTGIGMNEEQVGNLFQPFSQVDNSSTRKFSGTGLGLCISKHLAEALGGNITVRSTPGKGSTFSLTIDPGPLDETRMIQNAQEALPDRPPSATAATPDKIELHGRILLAEDGPDNQRLIALLLSNAGIQVTGVADGQLAVETALAARDANEPFDVILMDMQMPVMDGYEATRQLRARGYTAPIVALTASVMAGDCMKCLDAGCNDYLPKPFQKHALLKMMARHITAEREGKPRMPDDLGMAGFAVPPCVSWAHYGAT